MSNSLFLSLSDTHMYTGPQIGFREVTYNVHEGEGYLVVEVELKHNVMTALPITFDITFTDGEANSEFSQCFHLCDNRYIHLYLQEGQTTMHL